jgi:hypothetical protein
MDTNMDMDMDMDESKFNGPRAPRTSSHRPLCYSDPRTKDSRFPTHPPRLDGVAPRYMSARMENRPSRACRPRPLATSSPVDSRWQPKNGGCLFMSSEPPPPPFSTQHSSPATWEQTSATAEGRLQWAANPTLFNAPSSRMPKLLVHGHKHENEH